jgi:hypothetical protein
MENKRQKKIEIELKTTNITERTEDNKTLQRPKDIKSLQRELKTTKHYR